MTIFLCKCCSYKTNRRANYDRHLQSKKHNCSKLKMSNSLALISAKKNEQLSKTFMCNYCDSIFKHHSSLCRHIKYHCKNNKDEDLKELVRLLNKKVDILENTNENLYANNENMCKQINTLTKKLQIHNIGIQQNINNQQNIGNQINNINILNHKDTNYDFLTDKDYINCIKTCNHCVKNLIEKVHFDINHPENMNIYISSMKTDYLILYKNNSWNIVDRTYHIDSLYTINEMQIENWYDEYKDKYPHIINKFERYLHNREDNETINLVKKEILRMLYNKRKIVLNTAKLNNNYDNLGDNLIE